MGIEQNGCANCGKRGGLTKVTEFDGQKLPGALCKKCGFFIADKQSQEFNVSCDGCKKSMGYAAVRIPVIHMRTILDKDKKVKERQVTVLDKGEQKKKFMCVDCSKKRVENGEHDPDETLTRYETHCMVRSCGKVIGWKDAPEGTDSVTVDQDGYCKPCTPKAVDMYENGKAIDEAVKSVVSNGS